MKARGGPGPLETQPIKEALDNAREAAGALLAGRMPGPWVSPWQPWQGEQKGMLPRCLLGTRTVGSGSSRLSNSACRRREWKEKVSPWLRPS